MKEFKKIPKMNEAMWLFGIVLVALGVSICKKADLGVSMIAAPAFVIFEAVKPLWSGFSVGMVEYLLQGIVLIILCFAVRRFNWRYLLAFLVAVLYGYVLNFWLYLFGSQPFDKLYVRWIMLFLGDIITAAGVACFFRTYLPLQVHELFVSEFASRYRLSVNKTKMCFDLSYLALTLILAFTLFGDAANFDWSKIYMTSFHSVGLGTIITTFINAPIITVWGKLFDRVFDYEPIFPKLRKLLDRTSQPVVTAPEQKDGNNI